MKRTGISYKIISALIYVTFVLLMCLVISRKENLHVDGFFSYGLSNQTYTDHIGLAPLEGKVYTPAPNAWQEYLTVQEGARFDYGNVWKNQEEDVHPPLYYGILHTICSFFPNQFSIWFAASINIVFAVLTLFISRKLVRELGGNDTCVLLFSAAFSLSAGMLSSISLLRMYLVTMFWVTMVSWLFLKIYREGGKPKYFATLSAVCAAGILTHYYFILWLFFLSLVMGVYLLYRKKWKTILAFIVSVGAAGLGSVLIFPGMIYHIFLESGDRGEQSVQKLLHTSKAENLEKLRDYFGYLSHQLFGGFLPTLIFLAVVLLILIVFVKKEKLTGKELFPWFLLGVPCICYYVLIARISVYTADRYIQPIYPVVLVVGFGFLLIFAEKLLKLKKIFPVISCIVILMLSINGIRICPWEYLYREDGRMFEKLAAFSDCECLFVFDSHDPYNRIQQSYFEVRQYKSVVFIADTDLELLKDLSLEEKKQLVLCIDYACNTENVLEAIKTLAPSLSTIEELGKAGLYTTTWYLRE